MARINLDELDRYSEDSSKTEKFKKKKPNLNPKKREKPDKRKG